MLDRKGIEQKDICFGLHLICYRGFILHFLFIFWIHMHVYTMYIIFFGQNNAPALPKLLQLRPTSPPPTNLNLPPHSPPPYLAAVSTWHQVRQPTTTSQSGPIWARTPLNLEESIPLMSLEKLHMPCRGKLPLAPNGKGGIWIFIMASAYLVGRRTATHDEGSSKPVDLLWQVYS